MNNRFSRISSVFLNLRHSQLLHEFLRYVLVGGMAFIVDFGVLYLARILVFSRLGHAGILLAAALGFAAGLAFNFIFSLLFVFKEIDESAKSHKIRSFVLFAIIGITGLLITELCMYSGVYLFGQRWYLIVKIFATGIVLLWNYAGRKVFIFKGAKLGQ
jgi:putative flippase GtrA